MRNKSTHIGPIFLLLLAMLFATAGCGKITWTNTSVGVLSAGTTGGTTTGVAQIAVEQLSGYKQAGDAKDDRLKLVYALEDDPQNEIQVVVRNLAQDDKKPVIGIIGATSNDATMQVAGLVNFFNVPMIIPTADGNSLLPASNQWAFRLSAPGSAYAQYLFGQVLNQTNLGVITTDAGAQLGLSLAILYEQNTFGESAAVATAEAAMAQQISIAAYLNFPAENPSSEQLTTLAESVRTEKPSLVYLIASNPDTAGALVRHLLSSYIAANETTPLLLGQAGAFTTDTFLGVPEANGLYILRQRWITDNCPASVKTYYEAQAYASTYLMNSAASQALDALKLDKNFLTTVDEAARLVKVRETLRDTLKAALLDVPCIGNVSFDNAGQNKKLQFEIVQIQSGNTSVVASTDFLKTVISTILDVNTTE